VVDDIAIGQGEVAADRARTALGVFFGWAIERNHLDYNPATNISPRAQRRSRDRVLSEPELVQVWQACGDDDYGRIIKLLILTGQRRQEIGDLTWAEVDQARAQVNLPAERTKNGRPHVVSLSPAAAAIISAVSRRDGRNLLFGIGAGGFSGWSKAKAELDARIAGQEMSTRQVKPMPAWTLHDIRRSVVTHLHERGFAPPHVVEAIVNHVSGHLAGVAGVYNKAQYLAERRKALELWGDHVLALVEGRTSKVLPFEARAGATSGPR
jgi:integrase